MSTFERLLARFWNRLVSRRDSSPVPREALLLLGSLVSDGGVTTAPAGILTSKRAEHVVVVGKTGSGKSVLLRHMAAQDIERGRGFWFFDLHGDATAVLLRLVARQEQAARDDLSRKLIVIEPADADYSVGLNLLERRNAQHAFAQIAEIAQVLKSRWHLDSFGARTEELLRSALVALADSDLTLLELTPLLTDAAFRARCLRNCGHAETRAYFQGRYDQASEAMQAVYRDAVLNKVSGFVADPRFRHLVGQRESSFSLTQAIDEGYWIILNLDKGRLGEEALTLGSLFLTRLKNALFARRSRQIFTLYCDEVQNLVAMDSGLETLLSEARKFGVSVVTANQYLDQHSASMRAALLSVGSHVFFQLASADADKIAAALDGGRPLATLLKTLPPRHLVLKSGHHRWLEVRVPDVAALRTSYADLYERCRQRWAKRRSDIERDIQARLRPAADGGTEVLHGWD